MILRGYYYGHDSETDEHVVHVMHFPLLGQGGQPTEVRLPRSSSRDVGVGEKDTVSLMSFGDEVEVELRLGHSPVREYETPAPRAGGRVR